MKIGEVARGAGVGVETVRFYERKGLIDQPARPNGAGFRDYPEAAAERIRFVRQAQALGFSLREIEELLSLKAVAASDCGDVRARASAKLGEVEAKLAQLSDIRSALETLINACPGRGALRSCSIMEELDRPVPMPPSAQVGD